MTKKVGDVMLQGFSLLAVAGAGIHDHIHDRIVFDCHPGGGHNPCSINDFNIVLLCYDECA